MESEDKFALVIVNIKRVDFFTIMTGNFHLLQGAMLGLGQMAMRKLNHARAMKLNIKPPDIWRENKCPGSEYLSGFVRRNKDLSIR